MSSRQVNFYVHPEEQEWLEERLEGAGQFTIVRGLDESGRAKLSSTTVIKEFGKEDLKIYLVRPEDVDRICSVGAPNRVERFVDDLRSPVVEFSRCYFDERVLRRGRLYMVDSYYDDFDRLTKKPADFVAWGRKLIDVVRNSLERRSDGDYVSGRAREVESKAGVRLTAA
jgi:hypothetical protein